MPSKNISESPAIPRRAWIALGLFAAFAALYLLTLTHAYSYDGICYSLDVEYSAFWDLFHPNHLLYSWIGRMAYEVAQFQGYPGRALIVLQVMNALVAAGTLAGLFILVQEIYTTTPALLITAAWGLSRSYWEWAVDPGCYAWAAFAACVLLAVTVRADKLPSWAIGVLHGITILFHQLLVFAIPALLYRCWRRRPLQYLSGVMGVTVWVYLLVGTAAHGDSVRTMLEWALRPGGSLEGSSFLSAPWWSSQWVENALSLVRGFFDSVIVAAPADTSRLLRCALLFAMGVGLVKMAQVWGEKSTTVLQKSLWIWVMGVNLFEYFYLPSASRYRLLFMPALLVLLAQGMLRWKGRAKTAAAVLIVMMGSWNYMWMMGPQSKAIQNPDLVRASWVASTLAPGDAFLFAGHSPASITNVYVAYFATEILGSSVRGHLFSHPDGNITDLDGLLKKALVRKHRAFIESALLDPDLQRQLEGIGSLVPGMLGEYFGRLRLGQELTGPDGYKIREVL